MGTDITLESDQVAEIRQLLMGKKVVNVDGDTATLSDGTKLKLEGNTGCGGCESGWYRLDELNEVDNIITDVEVDCDNTDDPDVDYHSDTTYRLFVFAENRKINMATFTGTDGNGYYGSGFTLYVTVPTVS